jgi:hypothetical protein
MDGLSLRPVVSITILLVIFAVFRDFGPAYAQGPADILLADIAADKSTYGNKTLTLRLRLKYADMVFQKLVFYDRKNHDIVFDISGKSKEREFRKRMRNLHPGMEYLVTFTAANAGASGILTGDIVDFVPVVLTRLPEAVK